LKIEATIANARAVLEVQREHGSFGGWLWDLVGGAPVTNSWRSRSRVPAETPKARALSRALRELGFRFVGPTICYAFMQASGMVNDHTTACFRWRQLRSGLRGRVGGGGR
jgi:DNA-3-methyladenine glycosylase I